MNGNIPNFGSSLVDAHSLPNRNSFNPIFEIAGRPANMRYKDIRITDATVISPSIRNIACIEFSNKFFYFS